MSMQGVLKGTVWKFLERLGVFGTQFVVQIILARILSPSDYGMLAIMTVFITISNVLVQSGFSTALVQRKDTEIKDYSSTLWVSLIFATLLYIIIYLIAPFISYIYHQEEMTIPLRVIALVLFPGAINSVQLAKVSKELDFKKVFFSNIAGTIVSGVTGVIIAIQGGGIWALVCQTIINTTVSCIVMRMTVKIKFGLFIEWDRIKEFLSFGWKLVVSGILNTLSEQLNSLLIGIKYSSDMLGFYTRGIQFPHYGITIIEGTMSGVLLPSLAKVQDNVKDAKKIMKNAMLLSCYCVFPVMAGLSAISKNLILVLLTNKWLGCVIYLQVFCGVFALYPVHVCNLQTLNAFGRSDLFLKIEVIKKVYSISFALLMIILFKTPLAIAFCTLILSPVGWFVNSYPNKKLINYSFPEQIKDLIPIFIASFAMLAFVYPINYLNLNPFICIAVQVVTGVCIYVFVSKVLRIEQYNYIISLIRKALRKF